MPFSSVVSLRPTSYSFLFTSWISNSLWFILDADVSSLSVVQEVFILLVFSENHVSASLNSFLSPVSYIFFIEILALLVLIIFILLSLG